MADAETPTFAPFSKTPKGVLVLFCEEGLKFGPAARKALAGTGDLVQRTATADYFTGKSGSALEIMAPTGPAVTRLLILGVGKAGKLKSQDFVKLGGSARGRVPKAGGSFLGPGCFHVAQQHTVLWSLGAGHRGHDGRQIKFQFAAEPRVR